MPIGAARKTGKPRMGEKLTRLRDGYPQLIHSLSTDRGENPARNPDGRSETIRICFTFIFKRLNAAIHSGKDPAPN
jgi:hypothetical protein